MTIETIDIRSFTAKSFDLFDGGWFLLTAGSFADRKFNTMTVSWGFLGTMWNRPVAQVVVRPTRYTCEFIEASPDFTLCAFPAENRKALSLLGSKSGRDGDKITEAGLTPCPASLTASPAFAEASLVIECRKIYSDAFDPRGFIDPAINDNYSGNDYHHIYIGEVLAIRGDKTLYA